MTIESSRNARLENPDAQEKNLRWEEACAKVERMQGASGETVDDGIKETVIGLAAHGINTVESCAGHIDGREHMDAPYVDIESERITQIEEQFEELYGQSGENKAAADMVRQDIVRENLKERTKVISLLDAFYKERHTPFADRIIIEPHKWAQSRMINQGAGLQSLAEPEQRAENLKRFQKEMQAFGEFLKETYFQEKQKSRP